MNLFTFSRRSPFACEFNSMHECNHGRSRTDESMEQSSIDLLNSVLQQCSGQRDESSIASEL